MCVRACVRACVCGGGEMGLCVWGVCVWGEGGLGGGPVLSILRFPKQLCNIQRLK